MLAASSGAEGERAEAGTAARSGRNPSAFAGLRLLILSACEEALRGTVKSVQAPARVGCQPAPWRWCQEFAVLCPCRGAGLTDGLICNACGQVPNRVGREMGLCFACACLAVAVPF